MGKKAEKTRKLHLGSGKAMIGMTVERNSCVGQPDLQQFWISKNEGVCLYGYRGLGAYCLNLSQGIVFAQEINRERMIKAVSAMPQNFKDYEADWWAKNKSRPTGKTKELLEQWYSVIPHVQKIIEAIETAPKEWDNFRLVVVKDGFRS